MADNVIQVLIRSVVEGTNDVKDYGSLLDNLSKHAAHSGAELNRLVSRGRLREEDAAALRPLAVAGESADAYAGCGLVLEAVFEDEAGPKIKRQRQRLGAGTQDDGDCEQPQPAILHPFGQPVADVRPQP